MRAFLFSIFFTSFRPPKLPLSGELSPSGRLRGFMRSSPGCRRKDSPLSSPGKIHPAAVVLHPAAYAQLY
nr:MAG TPA: hypothetical protein [Caudoviricetes sp.]